MGKERHGFVTNSSSSSFIFAEGYTDIGMFNLIKSIAEKLLSINEKVLNVISDTETYSDWKAIVDTHDYGHAYWEAAEKLKEDYGLKACIKQFFEEEDITQIDTEDFLNYATLDDYELGKIEKLASMKTVEQFANSHFVDTGIIDLCEKDKEFRDKWKSEVTFLLTWYLDENDLDDEDHYDKYMAFHSKIYNLDADQVFEMAKEKLGGIALCSDGGRIPQLVVEELTRYTTHQCNHMG